MVVENERAAVLLLLRGEGREERGDLVVVCWANLELVESGAAAVLGPLLAMMLLLNAALAKERLAMKLIIGEVMWWRKGRERRVVRLRSKKFHTPMPAPATRDSERETGWEGESVYAER